MAAELNALQRLVLVLEAKVNSLETGLGRAENKLKDLDLATKRAERSINASFARIDEQIRGVTQRASQGVLNLRNAFVALGAGAVIQTVVKAASSFEQSLANVDTLLDGASVSIEKYRQQLLQLSKASSKDLLDLTQGLYQTISAGIPAVDGAAGAFAVLEQAQKAATAGLATTEESVRAITTVLNVYGSEAGSVEEISDKLFTTVVRGVTTFPELAGSIGQVLSVAKGFGVSFDEVLGVITSLTKAGFSTGEAMSSLRQALISVARPPENVQQRLKALNLEFGVTALQEKTFIGLLQEMQEKTGGSAQAITELFTDVDGLKGVLALTAQGFEKVNADIDANATAAGTTARALEKMGATFETFFGRFKNQVNAVLVEAGTRVMPVLQKALEDLATFVTANEARIVGLFEDVVEALVAIGQFVASNGQALIGFIVAFFAVDKIAGAAVALNKFIGELAGLGAAGGADAGTAFLGGFSQNLKGIGGLLTGLLRSPATVAAVAAAGVFLGTKLGEAMGDSLNAVEELNQRAIQARIDALDAEIKAKLKAKGFGSQDEFDATQAGLSAGDLVKLPSGKAVSPSEALATAPGDAGAAFEQQLRVLAAQGGQAANERAALEAAAQSARAERDRVAEDVAAADRRQADSIDSRIPTDRASDRAARARLEQIDAEIAQTEGEILAKRDREAAAAAARDRLLGNIASAEEGVRAQAAPAGTVSPSALVEADKAASKAGRAGESAAEKAARRARQIADAIADAEKGRIDAVLDADLAAFEVRRAAAEEAFEARLEILEREGASEAEIAAFRAEVAQSAIEFIGDEMALKRRAADEAIALAEREAVAKVAEFEDSRDAQLAIEQEFAAERLRILAETGAELDALRKRQLDNVFAKANAVFDEGEPSTSTPSGREEFGAAAVASQDPLGKLAEIPGLVGTLAGLAQLIVRLSSVVDGISEALESGVANFIEGMGAAAERLAFAFVDGMPKQLERIGTKVLPALIENVIASLPELITAWTLLLPRIAAAVIKSIPAIVMAFVRGARRAVVDIFEGIGDALTSGIAQAFADAAVMIYEAIVAAVTVAAETIQNAAGLGGFDLDPRDGSFSLGPLGGFNAKDGSANVGGFGFNAREGTISVPGASVNLKKGTVSIAGQEVSLDPRDWLHSGGMVGEGARDSIGARIMAAAGAAQFATGGIVAGANAAVGARLRRAMVGDDVPAVLQAGEAVLNRGLGVPAAGGPEGVARLNAGLPPAGAGDSWSISLEGSPKAAALLEMLLGRVRVERSGCGGSGGSKPAVPPGRRVVRGRGR